MKKEQVEARPRTTNGNIKSIHGIRLHNVSEIKPSERGQFLISKIAGAQARLHKTTAPEHALKIEETLNNIQQPVNTVLTKKMPAAKSLRKSGGVDVLEKPVRQPKTFGLPKTADVKVFKATVNAFGNRAIAADGVTQEGRTDVNLALATENFTFDDLFKDFDCENLSFFVFDDVNLHLKEKEAGDATVTSAWFNATLRMDKAPLSSFKDFLSSEQGIMVSGEIETADQDLEEKITPSAFTLTSAGSFMITLADGIILKSAMLNIGLNKDDNNQWKFEGSVAGTLQLNRLGNSPLELNATVSYADGTLHIKADTATAAGLLGIQNLSLENVSVEFSVGNENQIDLNADLKAGKTTFHFTGKISAEAAGMVAGIDEFNVDDLGNLYNYITGSSLAIPDFNIGLQNVYIAVANNDVTVGSRDLQKGFSIGCTASVYEHTCSADAVFSSSGIDFTGALENLSIGPVDITKAAMNISLNTTSSGKPSKFELSGEAVIEGLTLDCKVAYEKNTDSTTNTLLYAAIAADSFGLSTVFPEAKDSFLDTFRFSKIAFIYASADGKANDPDFDFEVKKGLQLLGVMDDIEALSTLTRSKKTGLVFSAHFGDTTDLSIALANTRLNLGSSVVCDELRIGLELTPKPAMNLLFGIAVTVPKQADPLHFDLLLEIGIADAHGSATMKGFWVNPFGVNGLEIGPELALQIGIIYAEFLSTGLPSEFGFAGGIKLGDISGKMAVSISEDPTHEILMGEITKLSPKNLVSFVSTVTGISIDDADVPDFFDLEELKLYCAPAGGNIGTISFEPGFSFAADLVLFEKRINVYALLNDTGIVAKGELDKIEIGPLKITGAHGGNPKFNLELTQENQSVYIDGAFEFLGTGESIYLDISNKGISFELEQKFLNLLKFVLKVKSTGSLSDPANLDFSLFAEFDNDLTSYLKTTVTQKILDAKSAADTSIDEAQQKVNDAEKAYLAQFTPAKQALDKAQADATAYLAKCSKDVNDQKAAWDKKIADAQAGVNNAKATYDNALTDAQNKVAQTKNDYDNSMRDAQRKVDDAQTAYNIAFNNANNNLNNAINNYNNSFGKAYNDLNNAQATVNSLQNQINDYNYKIKHAGWKDYFGRVEAWGIAVAGLETAKGTATLTLRACQAIVNAFQTSSVAIALNTARATLNAVQTGGNAVALQGAKQVLNGLQYGAGWIAFQSAQNILSGLRYGAQYTVWQTATGTLAAAQTTGRGALTAAEFTLSNIGNSVAYIALQAAQAGLELVKQGTAATAFESSKAVLQGTKQGVDGMLNLGAYIAEHSGDLLEVNKVTLTASLKAIENGQLFVSTFDGAIFGKTYHTTLDFNVKDTAAFVEKLFGNVLEQAKRIASV